MQSPAKLGVLSSPVLTRACEFEQPFLQEARSCTPVAWETFDLLRGLYVPRASCVSHVQKSSAQSYRAAERMGSWGTVQWAQVPGCRKWWMQWIPNLPATCLRALSSPWLSVRRESLCTAAVGVPLSCDRTCAQARDVVLQGPLDWCFRDTGERFSSCVILHSNRKRFLEGGGTCLVLCCRGDFGRLGHGHGDDFNFPTQISSLMGKQVASVSCGDAHTLVVLADGKLFGFGRNQNGQIGNGTTADCFECTEVQNLQNEHVIGASCGAEHSVCVTQSGSVYAWGWGRYGNLGTDSFADECVPTCVSCCFPQARTFNC